MPELPEVETVRRDLERLVIGRRVVSCRVAPDAARLVQLVPPDEFCRQLTGRTIAGLRRRGKYLIIDLDDGRAWVVHRRMSGNILYRTADAPPDDYTRAVFALDDGHELRWTDLRKFGTMWLVEDATMVMESLGPEPLDAAFTPDVLRQRAGKRGAPIKSVLLDQTVLAGMGNLYTDEALHYAKIHPLRPANKLKRDDWDRLHAGIVRALRMGLAARGSSLGSTLRDHINVDGRPARTRRRCRPTAARASRATPAAPSCAASRLAAAAASTARSASRRLAAPEPRRSRRSVAGRCCTRAASPDRRRRRRALRP